MRGVFSMLGRKEMVDNWSSLTNRKFKNTSL